MSSLNQIASIHRPSLHEELTDRLRAMIVEGVLADGEKVPEKALCEKLGVSRTPMREALKVLAADGLLCLEPNKGARVRAITFEDLQEVFPVMASLEALAGELACQSINPTSLDELKAEHLSMLQRYKEADMPAYFKHNERIHEIILEAARNRTLTSMYKTLAARIRSARYLANMTPERWQQAVEEHEEMIVALENQNAKELGAILKRHLENKFETVRLWVERNTETSA